jgi:hypothetical protein
VFFDQIENHVLQIVSDDQDADEAGAGMLAAEANCSVRTGCAIERSRNWRSKARMDK